jgi:hypothetical protein
MIDDKPLIVGESYYLLTGYGSRNVSTLHDECVSTELKLEATQKDIVACQNPGCRKHVPYDEMRRLKACPECGFPLSEQQFEMEINNLFSKTKLAVRKGVLTRVPNK